MAGLRFKVGELAILAVGRVAESPVGAVCEVFLIGGEDIDGDPMDYGVELEDGSDGAVMDWQLRKIDPPSEPASLTRTEECGVEA